MPLGQREQLVLQAEAVDLDAGHDHRPLGRSISSCAASSTASASDVADRSRLDRW